MPKNKLLDEDRSIIGWLYEVYRERHPTEPLVIKADFDSLYEAMNGMSLADTDKIIYPVCTLCTDYERLAFCEGVRVGAQLAMELGLYRDIVEN